MPISSVGGDITNDDLRADWAYKSLRWDQIGRVLSAGLSLAEGLVPSEELTAATHQAGFRMAGGDELYFGQSMAEWLQAQFDMQEEIQTRILYHTDGAASSTGIAWTVSMLAVAAGVALTDAQVSADGTAAFTGLTGPTIADGIAVTPWLGLGVKGKFPVDAEEIPTDLYMMVVVDLVDDGTAAADELKFISVDFRGVKKVCAATGGRKTT